MARKSRWTRSLAEFLIVVGWIAGVVLATGGWKIAAFCFPPYGYYLVVERLMQMCGMIR